MCRPKLISDGDIPDNFENIAWPPEIQDVPAPLQFVSFNRRYCWRTGDK